MRQFIIGLGLELLNFVTQSWRKLIKHRAAERWQLRESLGVHSPVVDKNQHATSSAASFREVKREV